MDKKNLLEVIKEVEKKLNIKVLDTKITPQGMDSDVFFVTDSKSHEYAIKCSKSSSNDALAYDLLKKNGINIPIPKIYCVFEFNQNIVLVLGKIEYPLLETVPVKQMHRYISSMIINLQQIHQIKSKTAGLLTGSDNIKDWKSIFLSKFDNTDSCLNWVKLSQNKLLDKELILSAVQDIVHRIKNQEFISESYSLLHTDFNQRNLFVNPDSDDITAIIDWGESVFGDPLYDFARVRLYIWHFNLGDNILKKHYNLLSFTDKQKNLEETYFLSLIIEYLAYYSEESTAFNLGRIKLHQDFLRNYTWHG